MSMPSKEEEALDALFRRARAEPNAEDLHRVKQQLHALAAQVEGPPSRWGRYALMSVLVIVGCCFFFAPTQTRATDIAAAPAPPPTSAVAPLEPPKPVEPVSVHTLASAPKETRTLAVARPPRPRPEAPPAAPPKHALPVEESAPEHRAPDAVPAAAAESEAGFLRRAKVSLAGDPSVALRMAEEHPSRYPHGALIQEREVLAIEALSLLGRTDEARARAVSFRSRFPSSAHDGHIDGLLKAGR